MNRKLRIRKKLNIWCAALVFLCALYLFPGAALASSVPDLSGSGSITIEMTCDGQAVSGGQIAVYMVGSIVQDSDGLSFSLSDDFSESTISLDIDYDSASELKALAAALAACAEKNDISGTTADVGSDGVVMVSDLSVGLYLVVQTQAADGYEAFAPFLVSLPMYDETQEAYIYDVDASPKVTIVAEEQEETTAAQEEQTASPSNEGEEESTASGGEEGTASGADDEEEGITSADEEGTEDETTASDGADSDVQTGDNSHLMIWLAAFWASALILIILVVRSRLLQKKR